MTSTSSMAIRAQVASGALSSADAVDRLLDAGEHGGVRDCDVPCPECGGVFYRSDRGRWNTCSDACQIAWNTAIFELDDGRTIVKISELTAERAADLLSASGLGVVGLGFPGSGSVVPS